MKCPDCGSEKATYQSLSGGELGYCPECEDQFPLDRLAVEHRPRAVLLKTEAGRVALRAQMDQRLAQLKEKGI